MNGLPYSSNAMDPGMAAIVLASCENHAREKYCSARSIFPMYNAKRLFQRLDHHLGSYFSFGCRATSGRHLFRSSSGATYTGFLHSREKLRQPSRPLPSSEPHRFALDTSGRSSFFYLLISLVILTVVALRSSSVPWSFSQVTTLTENEVLY